MRVGIEVQRLFRKKKFGIETTALQLIQRIAAKFPNTEFIIFAKKDEDMDCLQLRDNLRIRTLESKAFFDFEHYHLPRAAKEEKIDVLHCTGNTRPLYTSVPVVQTLHDLIFMEPIPKKDSLYQRLGNLYRRKLIPYVTPRSEAVITVSEYERQRIIHQLPVSSDRVRVIYNGIDEYRFRPVTATDIREAVRARYRLPDQFILFLGNEAARKNASGVIEAYAHYYFNASNPLPIVTPGLSAHYIKERLTAMEITSIFPQFKTIGYVDAEDLPAIYSLADLFLFPSLAEGFGMPVIESMACGTPVLTSNTTSLPEVAGRAAILVDPLDPLSIARNIDRITADPQMNQDYRQRGLERARYFSGDRTADQVYETYERAASARLSPSGANQVVHSAGH